METAGNETDRRMKITLKKNLNLRYKKFVMANRGPCSQCLRMLDTVTHPYINRANIVGAMSAMHQQIEFPPLIHNMTTHPSPGGKTGLAWNKPNLLYNIVNNILTKTQVLTTTT